MERYVENFPALLSGVDLVTLEADPHSIYALSDQLKLIYLNPAWFRFALENNGEPGITERYPVGSDFSRAVSGVLKQYYIERFLNVLRSGVVWEHDYECSSPDLFRMYHETAYPMHNQSGILVMSSLRVQSAHAPASGPFPLSESLYRNECGLIMQCGYCRRFQRNTNRDIWDWNPEWLRHPPGQVSHSLCNICYDYYFKHQTTSPGR